MNLIEIWHYHRPALAKIYLDTLNAGLVTSTTIFAPRRTGKTSFLLKDLTPAAETAGYTVSYIELGDTGKHTQTDIALKIDVLIETLCKKKPILLLIDEAQELAKTKEHEAVAMALRTAITRNQDRLRVVFTGSSRTQLAHVFSNSNAPLYSTGSAIFDFPLLGHDFVEYIAARFATSTGRILSVARAWKAFVALKQQPEPFLAALVDMMLNPSVTLDKAMQNVADKLALTENHEGAWTSLDATQKALIRMLAQDPTLKPFSKAVVLKLRTLIGVESLEVTHVQRAMTKLTNVVFKSPRDTYEFENEAFAQWVRTLAD
jgi:hypothetical protein